MRLLPKDQVGRIEFCEGRVGPWAERAAEIGTTPQQVAELAALTAEARLALSEQRQAQQAARAATLRLNDAIARMSTSAGAILLQVRCEAARAGEGVYAAASIAPPAQASPLARPGTPYGLSVTLHPNGSLTLSWKCDNPRHSQGTVYQMWRRVDGAGELKYVGGTGKKRFVDETVPAGTAVALYQIRAERSTKAGEWAQFNVNLGMPKGSPRSMGVRPTQWTLAA